MSHTCKRCGKQSLTKSEFVNELAVKHSITVDPYNVDQFRVSGVATGVNAYERFRENAQTVYSRVQQKRAFQCVSCGAVYCWECLFNHAPASANGGKACFSCRGNFREM